MLLGCTVHNSFSFILQKYLHSARLAQVHLRRVLEYLSCLPFTFLNIINTSDIHIKHRISRFFDICVENITHTDHIKTRKT